MEKMDLAKQQTALKPDELEALFKFIPSSQLLKFRQQSEELDEVAKIVLRKRRDFELLLTTDNLEGRTNQEFLQFLNNSLESAFVAPVIHIENTNKSDQDLEEGKICNSFQIIQEICKRLGNRGIIKKLIIKIKDGRNAPHFTSDFVFSLLSHLSTLETLEISGLQLTSATSENNSKFQLPSLKQITFAYKYKHCDVNEAGNLFKKIIESSPKLECISAGVVQLRNMNVISMLRDAKQLSKMKELTLTKSEELEILLKCEPKLILRSFEIEMEDEDAVDSKKLFTFLQQQADNLKSLACEKNSLVPKSIFTLPVLPVLEKLTFESWDSDCLISVNYGRQTPALKTLTFFSTGASWEKFLFYEVSSEMPPCLSLEKIVLFINEGRDLTYQKFFDNWKKLFPNVKKLSFVNPKQLDMEQFSKCWPKLESLELELDSGLFGEDTEDSEGEEDEDSGGEEDEDYKDLDELLFGISRDWKREIDTSEEEWWMKIPAPEITRTVANLKSLKKLKVYLMTFEGTVPLTDFAVYFGLKHMQNLRKLEIIEQTTSEHGEICLPAIDGFSLSKEAFNFLVKNLPELEKLQVAGQEWKRGEILK